MAIARHGTGPGRTVAALASQVHPVFMLPPVAAAVVGGVLAVRGSGATLDWAAVSIHLLAIFLAVYTAHVMDGYVDFYGRGEDDDHPLTPVGCRLALAAATVGEALSLAGLWVVAGPAAAALTAPGWLVGALHAPLLDANPVTATAGYPFGIALAVASGAYAQVGTLPAVPAALAGVLFVVLCGVKVVDDAQDYAFDSSIEKRTVAVALGPDRGRDAGLALQVAGLGLTVALAALGVFPDGAVLAVFAFGAVAWVAADRSADRATMLLVRGSYVFLALLVAAIWYRPLTGSPAVDIGVLGPYTYLATELGFGAAALALCWRAGALRRAAGTIAMLYPVAYIWDWYTLRVGVFAIELRTGVDLLGIPLEEHLFMVVVPALVIGVHEYRLQRATGRSDGSAGAGRSGGTVGATRPGRSPGAGDPPGAADGVGRERQ